MREKDAVSREYFSDPYHFAQICNNALFKGKKLIQPEKLTELDPEELKNMGIKRGKVKSLRKSKDLLKLYDSELFIAVLGIENQSDLHYGMPLRNLLYDALNYESQRCKLLKEHRIKGDLNKAEYISGFGKEDRLIPVITLVIYYGDEPWTGGKALHDILEDISVETVQAISVLGEAKGLEEKMKKIEAGEEQKNMKSAWQELVEDWKQEER